MQKKVVKKPKAKVKYYQLKDNQRQVNFIYILKGKAFVSETIRIPYEEGMLQFVRHSGGELLSSTLDIHEFADHLNIAYKKKNY